jgi:para-nitrobenzyl esterase
MSQHMPLHRCENLARQTGCVVVSINYRMGVLGFAGFDDPAAGADANCGLVDCETALRWVQRYAHNFGGDAGKVTIMGQSAGSMLCNSLMAMPRCKDLFRNAVLVSGIAQFTKNEADARATLRRLARRMGLADPDDQADLARGLRKASLNELMRLQKSVEDEFQRDFRNFVDMQEQRLAFCPRVELSTLPQHPVDAAFERPDLAADRTIVISTTTAEYNFFLVLAGFVKGVEPLDDSRADRRIRHLFGHERCSAEKAAEIVDVYSSTRGRESGQGWHVHGSHDTAGVWSEACSDVFFRLPSETFADAVAEAGGNAVVCRFAEPAAFPGKFQAAHAVDLHYWLGNRFVPPYFNGLMPFGAHARRFDQVSGTMVELVGDVCWGRHVSAPVWRKRGDGPRGPVMIFGDPAALKNPEGAPVARVADTCEAACAGDDARTAVWDDLTQLARERTTVQVSP